MSKYVKTNSLTWWVSFAPLLAGVFLATVDIHGWKDLVSVINELSGNMSSAQLIQLGLVGIGIRGALPGGNKSSMPERY